MNVRYPCLLGGLLPVLLVAGCSGSGTVSGKVSCRGETLGGGTVLFVAPGQKSVSSPISADGSYTISAIPTGTVKIAVETKTAQPLDEDARSKGMPSLPKDAQLPPGAAENPIYKSLGTKPGKYVWIPDDYGDPEKSNLSLEVTGGNQHHDIELP